MFASDPAVAGRSVQAQRSGVHHSRCGGERLHGPVLERAHGHLDPVGHAAGVRPEPVDRCPHELARTRRSIAPGTEPGAGGRSAQRPFRQRASELPSDASARLLVLLPRQGSSPVRGELGSALIVLFALSGLALALACVNVACLAAVRSAGRQKEIAIRLALGARRSRLQRQLLTEGLVLAAIGGIAGAADRALGGPGARRRPVHRAPDRAGPRAARPRLRACSCRC